MATTTDIKTIAVIGTGVIGSSWTALFLAKGLKVIVSPSKEGGVQKLKDAVAKTWPVLQKMGMSDGASQSNLEFVNNVMDHLDRVDFVTENGPESLEYKIKTFAALDTKCKPHVPLVSNTSGFPSSKFITGCSRNPERVLVTHPLNPPHLIPAVEVVPHAGTSEAIIDRVMAFYRCIGQQPLRINIETPAFVMNRLQSALIYEAYSLVNRGVISPSDLDAAVTGGLGLRWAMSGPFMNLSLTGGGGPRGFERTVDHIGPAASAWIKGMDDYKFEMNDETKKTLIKEVEGMFEEIGRTVSLDEMMRARDETIVKVIELKKQKGLS